MQWMPPHLGSTQSLLSASDTWAEMVKALDVTLPTPCVTYSENHLLRCFLLFDNYLDSTTLIQL